MRLPDFITDALASNTTSLGNNPVFPTPEFAQEIVVDRFKDVVDSAKVKNLEDAKTALSKAVKMCVELEKNSRPQLQKICMNSILKIFDIPKDTINITCTLVDDVKPHSNVRITPESVNPEGLYSAPDVMDKVYMNQPVVAQRRVIDALIQGASYDYATDERIYGEDIAKVNKKLPKLYKEITALKDYILFMEEERVSNTDQGHDGYVEVILGKNGNRTNIKAQATIFPFLLKETLRGLFELFSSHGLPSDDAMAMAIVKNTDFMAAEAWDLRLGVGLWGSIIKHVKYSDVVPYLFTDICKMQPDEFNEFMQQALNGNVKGTIDDMLSGIEHDMQYDKFVDRMKVKNAEHSLLSDSVEHDETYYF